MDSDSDRRHDANNSVDDNRVSNVNNDDAFEACVADNIIVVDDPNVLPNVDSNIPNSIDDLTIVREDYPISNDAALELQDEDTVVDPECEKLRNSGTKKSRNSVPDKVNWKRVTSKAAREKGQEFLGFRRVDPSSSTNMKQDALKPARKMGPSCTSKSCEKKKNHHCGTVSEEERHQMFLEFWNMNWHAKKTYVCSSVVDLKPQKTSVNPKTGRSRTSTFCYYLRLNGEKIRVCQNTYLSTFGLKRSEVRYWLENFRQANKPDLISDDASTLCENTELNEHSTPSSAPSQRRVDKVLKEKALTEFLDNLPTMPSHYCRKDSNKVYLQADVTSWAQLYGWYQTICAEKNVHCFSRNTFSREVKRRKLGIFKPKKDRCDTCLAFEKKNISREGYEMHIKRKEAAQLEKDKDKELGMTGAVHVICFDMMNVQTVPKTRSSIAYYKLKLMLHNFTVYNLVTQDAQCYWFDETEANLSATVFASCIIDYITELTKNEKKPVIMYSDGCNYQNRNSVLSNALLHFSVAHDVPVTHKYLEKGHTYMEGDSVHSTVERYIENKDLDLPSQFVRASTEARKHPMPYRAKYLDHTFFKNFNENVKYSYIRPGANRPSKPKVTDLRVLLYQPDWTVSYKLNFDEEFQVLPARPKKIDVSHGFNFPPAFMTRFKIKKDKFNDLQSLKPAIHRDAWYYYDAIPHDDESIHALKRKNTAEHTKLKGKALRSN